MSKIENHFHDEIEAQASELHEQSEPDIREAKMDSEMAKRGKSALMQAQQQGWHYDPRYQG